MKNPERGRTAPTWLFNRAGETKLFRTQEEVDLAWETGWFSSDMRKQQLEPLLSTVDWTKNQLFEMVKADSRYHGHRIDKRLTVDSLRADLIKWELDSGLMGD